MIPYFGTLSAKQRVQNKNLVLDGLDGHPYILIPYSGTKGIGGTAGKDLTLKLVIE